VTPTPGSWTDVFLWVDGRLGQVAVEGAVVRCYLEGVQVWQQTAPEPLLFCRCDVHQQLVLSVHQGQSGRGWLIGNGLVHDLDITFGVQPVAIDAVSAYVVRSPYAYDRINLKTGETVLLPSGAPGSSQGISDIADDGSLWWADLHRSVVIAGETLTYPNRRGAVTVGQADPPSIALALNGIVSTVISGDAFEPHTAVSGNRAAVCARTGHGAAYVVVDLTAVAPMVPAPVPLPVTPPPSVPAPPPPHAPVPIPKPTPVPAPIPAPVSRAVPFEVAMSTKKVALRLGQFFGRIDPASSGKGPFGWFPVVFDQRDPSNPECVFEQSGPANALKVQHEQTRALLGADATEFSDGIAKEFYGKPNEDQGGYETWHGWQLGQDGINIVLVEYDRDGAKYASACLTVVEL
jgi:hypothetical protein